MFLVLFCLLFSVETNSATDSTAFYNRHEIDGYELKLFRLHKDEVKSAEAKWGVFSHKDLTPDEIQNLIEILSKVSNKDIKSHLGQPAPKGGSPRMIILLKSGELESLNLDGDYILYGDIMAYQPEFRQFMHQLRKRVCKEEVQG
ncbi:hypothetical protein [Cohnella abietis]|nr:hypothetical protein [Cohnella abietis]